MHDASDTRGSVRHPTWQGVQVVTGLWLAASLSSEAERARRLLAVWHAGCRAYRFADGDVLLFADARLQDCAQLAGTPLCRIDGLLCGAPLTPDELRLFTGVDLVLVQGGSAFGLRLADAVALDPSTAIDTGDQALLPMYDCTPPTTPVRVPRLDGGDARRVLGDAIPPPSAEHIAFLRRLHGQPPARQDGGALRRGFAGARDALVGSAWSLLHRLLPDNGASQAPGASSVPARQSPRPPSAWRQRLARLAVASRLGGLIGHRQGAYLRRMMRMFETGDLDEALRNALPLDGIGDALGQAFGVPGRRESLALSPHRGAATGIGLDDALKQQLRTMYRDAFTRFDRAGRVDEAVFVLAELLNARQEALDYLVKHGRHAQAAELALGWDMPAASIIRLLMLAGDSTRAFQVARRDQAFAAAIHLLQTSHPDLAAQLRRDWAQALVAVGDWLAAVDAVWPLQDARDNATQWLLIAERAGVALSARALVQRAVLLPDTLALHAGRIDALSDPAGAAAPRDIMVTALLSLSQQNGAVRTLATCLLPAVAADSAAGRSQLGRKQLNALMKLAADAWLKADMPDWAPARTDIVQPLWTRSSAMDLPVPPAGLHPIHDVVRLDDGDYLLALGEAGTAVANASGRIHRRLSTPAHRLVAGDGGGQSVLAIARRERVAHIARIDPALWTASDLGVLALQHAARALHGFGWTVVVDNRILVIDATRALDDVLWHVGDLPGPIVATGFFASCEIYLVAIGESVLQDWTYSLPGRRLRARSDLPIVDREAPLLAHRIGPLLQPQVLQKENGDIELVSTSGPAGRSRVLCSEVQDTLLEWHVAALEAGLLVSLSFTGSSRHLVVALDTLACVAALALPPGIQLGTREQQGHLLLHTSDGRIIDIDVERSLALPISVL